MRKQRVFFALLGAAFLLLSFFFSITILEDIFSPDGHIDSVLGKKAVFIGRYFLLFTGLIFFYIGAFLKRPPFLIYKTVKTCLVIFIEAVFVFCAVEAGLRVIDANSCNYKPYI